MAKQVQALATRLKILPYAGFDKAEIDRCCYAKIGHDEANVTLNVADKVAVALGVSLVELFRAVEKE